MHARRRAEPAEVCALTSSPAPPPRRRLFRRLFRVAGERTDADDVAIGDVVEKLGDRSFGWVLLFFSVLSLLPIPGGGMFTAIPLFWVLGQMALGYPRIRLPDFVTRYRVNRRTWQRLVLRMAPVIRPVERLLQPRMEHLFNGRNERALGAFQFLTTFALFLPVPLSGFVPAAALVVTGLGMVERDGKVVLLGVALGFVSIIVTVVVGRPDRPGRAVRHRLNAALDFGRACAEGLVTLAESRRCAAPFSPACFSACCSRPAAAAARASPAAPAPATTAAPAG